LLEWGAPVTHASLPAPAPGVIATLADRIARAERGLVVCGPAPLAQAAGRDAILALARRTGFPLLAESTSQVRFGVDRSGVRDCAAFDAVLRAPRIKQAPPPDLILQLGAPPTSSAYADLCTSSPAIERVVVAAHGWNDPQGDASALLFADPGTAARAL